MLKTLNTLLISLLLSLSLSAQTLYDIISASPVHTTLKAAVDAAGLDVVLDDPNVSLTAFAPDDDAFDALPPGTLDDLLADPSGLLTQILLYHGVFGEVSSSDLSDGLELPTIQGQNVLISINPNGIFVNNAEITLADLPASNGILHVIDAVLIPDLSEDPTLYEIISNSPDHTILNAALIAAGLDEVLNDEDVSLTVFAPTDDAFAALPPGLIDELLADPQGLLTQVLLYHVVDGVALSEDLEDGQEITTLLGQDITVTINSDGVFINDAQVTVADIVASNGVLHVIDAILLPSVEQDPTLYEIISNSPDHTILNAALIAAGLDEVLNDEDVSLTVFAPTDDAFAALPPGLIDELLADPQGLLTQVLLYHVVDGVALSEDLEDGQEITTLLGQDITVTINSDGVFINDAQVTVADIVASNGVLHVIDVVLIPAAPGLTVYDIIAESPVHTVLNGAILAAGLDGALGDTDLSFTVFAPTDDAFANLPPEVIESLISDPEGALSKALRYHVVAGRLLAEDLEDGESYRTLLGQNILVTIDQNGVFINDAQVIVADLEAVNGVVHVIDVVLLPSALTVYDVIASSPVHNVLKIAVDAAELDEALQGEGPFTVFAPTDEAFEALPPGLIDELLADPTGLLRDILLYHVLGEEFLSDELEDGGTYATLFGPDVTITINEDGVFVNNVEIIITDIETFNGVVHVIEALILPPAPRNTIYTIVSNSPIHTILKTAVDLAGFSEALDDDDNELTLFAPTDEAFEALPPGLLDLLLSDPDGALAKALLYHVSGGTILSEDLNDGDLLETLLGQPLEVTINQNGVFINNAQIIISDIIASNGVVHVLDAVLIPVLSVYGIIEASPVHTILKQAIDLAGLDEALQDITASYTVFAPTDDAFAELPEGLLEELLQDPTGKLREVLLYHVLGLELDSEELIERDVVNTLLGQDVELAFDGFDLFVNDARVLAADIGTFNGIVHVIDKVLIPEFNSVRFNEVTYKFNVMPNPTIDFAYVEIPEVLLTGNTQAVLVNMSGKVLQSWVVSNVVEKIDFSTLAPGTYIFKLSSGNQMGSAIIVKH